MTSAEISALRHKILDPQVTKKKQKQYIKLLPVAYPPLTQGIAGLKNAHQQHRYSNNLTCMLSSTFFLNKTSLAGKISFPQFRH